MLHAELSQINHIGYIIYPIEKIYTFSAVFQICNLSITEIVYKVDWSLKLSKSKLSKFNSAI